jgi:hypothetical protein
MKSEYRGHCQACGRLQMLPNGLLSKHGYTVAFGFFSGVCVGSGKLPFEESCGLVKTFIESARDSLFNVKAFQAKLRETPTEGKAYVHIRLADPNRFSCYMRKWRIPFSDGSGRSYGKFWRTGDTRWGRNEFRGYEAQPVERTEVSASYGDTLDTVCRKRNAEYADWLQHEVDSLKRYIAWQTERVTTWKQMPLLPVDAKDKEGFKPTVAAY